MVKVYYDADVSLDNLKDRTIAVIGYGNQGHAQA
ncbi:MAG: ketol-acid reductoisomerase, partial [Candidatus Bathyarchaeia archaeon]